MGAIVATVTTEPFQVPPRPRRRRRSLQLPNVEPFQSARFPRSEVDGNLMTHCVPNERVAIAADEDLVGAS
jgi:hypothetical protein